MHCTPRPRGSRADAPVVHPYARGSLSSVRKATEASGLLELLCRLLPSWSLKWEPSSNWEAIGARLNISQSQRASTDKPVSSGSLIWTTLWLRLFGALRGGWAPLQPNLMCHWSCAIRSSTLASLRLTRHSEFHRMDFPADTGLVDLGFCSEAWKWQQLSVGMYPFRVTEVKFSLPVSKNDPSGRGCHRSHSCICTRRHDPGCDRTGDEALLFTPLQRCACRAGRHPLCAFHAALRISVWVFGPRAVGRCLCRSSATDLAPLLRRRCPGWFERSHVSCVPRTCMIGQLRSSRGGRNIPFRSPAHRCSRGPTLTCMSSCFLVAGDLLLSSVMCKRQLLPTLPGPLQRSRTAPPCSHTLALLRPGLLSWRYCRPLWRKVGPLLQIAFVAKASLYIMFAPNWPICLAQQSVRPHLRIGGRFVVAGVTEKPAVRVTLHCCQVSDTALFVS